MKIKENMKTILYTTVGANAGQVRIENAQEEIRRLKKLQPSEDWRMDYSDLMFVEDECDPNVFNPCPRDPGFVWLTKTQPVNKQHFYTPPYKDKYIWRVDKLLPGGVVLDTYEFLLETSAWGFLNEVNIYIGDQKFTYTDKNKSR